MDNQMPKMSYYKLDDDKDLFDEFKNGLMPSSHTAGFVRGAIYKYNFRYDKKGQRNSDLDKLVNYAIQLRDLEWDHSQDTSQNSNNENATSSNSDNSSNVQSQQNNDTATQKEH